MLQTWVTTVHPDPLGDARLSPVGTEKAGFPRLTVRDKVDPGPATQVPPGSLLRRKTPGSHLKPQSQIWHFSKILWEFICILAFEKQKSKRC